MGPSDGAPRVFVSRGAYEEWIRRSRAKARRKRVYRRIGFGLMITGAILAAALLLAAMGHAAPIGSGVETYPKAPSLEQPRQKTMTLADGEAECKRSGGEWFVDDKSEGLPAGAKIVGCMWLVPKGMK